MEKIQQHGERLVAEWIDPRQRVLDLGCGNGSLLRSLAERKQVFGYGVELDSDAVAGCIESGVPVIQADIERGLPLFADGSFDTVLLLSTLQELGSPAAMLEAMLRVGRRAVVTFANAGHWRRRLAFVSGRIDGLESVGGGRLLRLITVADFEAMCTRLGLRIERRTCLDAAGRKVAAGVRAELAAYMLARKGK